MKPNKNKIVRIRKSFPITNKEAVERSIKKKRWCKETVYDDVRFPGIAYSLCLHTGADNKVVGAVLGVGPNTIKNWTRNHEKFRDAIRRGRDEYDTDKVESSLLSKALGYSYEEETWEREVTGHKRDNEGNKILTTAMVLTKLQKKQKAPDITSIIFWLKNRHQERWRDVKEKKVEYPDGPPIHNHLEQTLNMFLNTATDDQLKALEGLANQQPIIEVPSGNSVSHG